MPRQIERAIPRGEGADDPAFVAPQVAIQTPGLAQQPQVDKFTQLQAVLFSGLGDLASGLSNIGRAAEVVENKKKEVLAQQDRELAESDASLQQQRFVKAQKEQRNLLMDERASNPEWLMQQSSAKLANSATEAEKEVWFRIHMAAKSDRDQQQKNAAVEAKRQKLEDLNLAGLTASRVIQTLEVDLQNNPELQEELMGNGEGIVNRVQDWVLSEVSDSEADLFHLDASASKDEKQSRDKIMGQLLSQSLGIADTLTKQHVKRIDAAKETHAVESLDALMLGIQKGQVPDDETVDATLQYIDQNYLNHMTTVEKDEFKQQYLSQAIKDAASLTFTEDITQANKAIDTFVKKSDISQADSLRAREMANNILAKTAADKYSALLDNEVASRRVVVPTKEGGNTTVALPNTSPIQTLSQEDEFGVSLARRLAEEFLTESGIGPERTDLSISESGIRQEILDAADQIEKQGKAERGARVSQLERGNQARMNLITGDAKAMYETNPLFLSRSPEGILSRPDLIAAVEQSGGQWGLNPDVPPGVGPVAMIPETRPARAAIMTAEAQSWDKLSVHNFPEEMLTDVANKFKSKSSEDMYDVAVMFRSLSLRKIADFQKEMGKRLTMPEIVALDSLRQASVSTDPSTWEDAFLNARNIMENDQLTPEAMAQGARDQYGQFILEENEGFKPTARARKEEALGLLMQSYQNDTEDAEFVAFPGSPIDTGAEFREALRKAGGFTDDMMDFLAARHYSLRGLGMDDAQASQANKALLKQDGYRLAAWGDEIKIIRDPMNVLGYGPVAQKDTQFKIQRFLNAPLKGDALKNIVARYNIKPGDSVPTTYWQAMKMADPERFGTMQPTDVAPTDWVLATDDSMWENYAFRPPVNGQPQAVAMLRFRDVNGTLRPITTADGELASAYSQHLFEQVEPIFKAQEARRNARVQEIVDKFATQTTPYAARNSF